jgi:hypothetical protein
VIAARLDDPGVAAALVTLLDNAELLSTLVLGLVGAVGRSDVILETIASGIREVRDSRSPTPNPAAPSLGELRAISAALGDAVPTIMELLSSPIVAPETVATVSILGQSATEGVALARRSAPKTLGVVGLVKALKDPDVSRGVGVAIEIAKALGRRIGSADPLRR